MKIIFGGDFVSNCLNKIAIANEVADLINEAEADFNIINCEASCIENDISAINKSGPSLSQS